MVGRPVKKDNFDLLPARPRFGTEDPAAVHEVGERTFVHVTKTGVVREDVAAIAGLPVPLHKGRGRGLLMKSTGA